MDWVFGFLWWLVSTIAIFLGGTIAVFISFGIAGGIGNAIEGTIEGVAAYVAFWTILPLILTAIVGIAQAWLLRQRIPIAHWFRRNRSRRRDCCGADCRHWPADRSHPQR
jgi:hypothetical protein